MQTPANRRRVLMVDLASGVAQQQVLYVTVLLALQEIFVTLVLDFCCSLHLVAFETGLSENVTQSQSILIPVILLSRL